MAKSSDSWSIFDVIGPVMVGPSSSHTAGACKIGYMASIVFGPGLKRVVIELHGSFAEVYEGHATDVALIGGILGYLPHQSEIKEAYTLAEERGIEIELKKTNLGAKYHPNAVRFQMYGESGNHLVVEGASLGGGKAVLTSIDKIEVWLSGGYSSLLIRYDEPDFSITDFLKFALQENIEIKKTTTYNFKNYTILDIQTPHWFSRELILKIEKTFPKVHWARFVNHISHYEQY